jgi:hypothetical protein
MDETEFRALVERQIKDSLDMTLPQFEAALKDGTLDPETPRVARLAILAGARAS